MNTPIRVGLIGLGNWAQNMLRVAAECPDTRLVSFCDVDPARLAFAARAPWARATTQAEDVIADPEVQAVYIATPPASHGDLAVRAIAAGKHVLVEKPMAIDAPTAREMERRAAAAGVTLMVGHTFVYSPAVRKIKHLLEMGTLGEVFYVESQRVNLGKYQDAGVLWDLGPHDLSILLYWLGEAPIAVSAHGRSFAAKDAHDVVFVNLQFPSGVMAQLHLSWLAPVKLRRMTISGSRTMVVYDDTLGAEAVKVYDRGLDRVRLPQSFGEGQLTYRTGDATIPQLENVEPLRAEWEHFVRCVREGQRPASDADQGARVVEILEAAARSLATGQVQPVGDGTWPAVTDRWRSRSLPG